ncbi:Hsp70 family protein [Flavivirga spongiicola]|uniref:Hsp70 family protein n=1 Tax=Flavivirga spongiicola TaxID=421621 RepID=A0ABU7XZR3_9FLAO|nr:Hsp70 family protein [Flavivirga sp. MEBiC05379]MDO5980940.1 Hsp70 family protein [Flavivirga sp. MEBiC05379]
MLYNIKPTPKTLLFLLLFSIYGFSQTDYNPKSYRKHFLIFYDISYPHYSKEEKILAVKSSFIKFFENKVIRKEGAQKFFDPNKDQISYYHFGINKKNTNYLKQHKDYLSRNEKLYSSFVQKFIFPHPEYDWSSYKRKYNNTNVSEYIKTLWSIEKPGWRNGISLSHLIYPMGLDAIDKESYAEEFIIIVLSDFLTGSDFGNKEDIKLIKRVFEQSYYYDRIISKYETLKRKFHKIDYFEQDFNYYDRLKKETTSIGFLGYKVTPNSGKIKPEDTWLSYDSDIVITQKAYESIDFELSPQSLKFSHNSLLSVDKVILTITDKHENILENVDVNYSVTYDKNLVPIYKFSKKNIALKTAKSFALANEKGADSLNINYSFYTKYQLYTGSFLNTVFKTPKRTIILNAESFIAKPKQKNYTLMSFLLILPLMIILGFFIWLGKPKGFTLNCSKFSDSLETLKNDDGLSRLLTGYLPFSTNGRGYFTNENLVTGNLKYRKNALFQWKSLKIRAELFIDKKPENIDIYLKRGLNTTERAYPQEPLIVATKDGAFNFYTCYESNDPNFKLDSPEEIKVHIHVKTRKRILFISFKNETDLEIHFQIGPELGNTWVGIDPGTTGTCIAVSNSPGTIHIGKEIKTNKQIMPSVLSFNPDREFKNAKFPHFETEGIDSFFRFGSAAIQRPDKDLKFQSVKKLIGYKDAKKIPFNDKDVTLTGRKLTALLINGAFRGMRKTVENQGITFDTNEDFNPQRAVVAVPNNFTITKIMDMIGAFDYVLNEQENKKRFKEVRYIFEAEAIAFYYLANRKKYTDDELKQENILIFDMGGATINTSVITLKPLTDEKGQTVYDSNIQGKLGYSIGGDTIDYVLLKICYEESGSSTSLHNYLKPAFNKNANLSLKNKLKQFALSLKMEIIKNNQEKKNYILSTAQLNNIIRNELSITAGLDSSNSLVKLFNNEHIEQEIAAIELNLSNKFITQEEYELKMKELKNKPKKLYDHPLFIKYIINNIKSAIDDVVSLANKKIDTIIFSGRSVFFPEIKQTVSRRIGKVKNTVELSFDESKTAVAKGACWYGVAKSGITVNNIKTNGVFGFKHTKTGVKGEEEFVELIPFGKKFNGMKTPKATGKQTVKSNFKFDNHHVEFYQIMGKNAQEIVRRDDMSHKKNKVARIRADQDVIEQYMEVYENDMVDCAIKLVTGKPKKAKNIISDMEITNENEEHYTWYIE